MPFVPKRQVQPASPPLWSILVFWATAKAAVVAEVRKESVREEPYPNL